MTGVPKPDLVLAIAPGNAELIRAEAGAERGAVVPSSDSVVRAIVGAVMKMNVNYHNNC